MFGWATQCTAGKDRVDLASEEQGFHCNFILQCRVCTFTGVKEKLLRQKNNTGMSPYNTEKLCKVWAKTQSCFLNKSYKNWSISFEQSNRVQISNFIGLLCLKGKLLQQKTFTGVFFGDPEGLWKVWPKSESCFPNELPKNWSVGFELAKSLQISNCSGFFCLKSTLLESKTFTTVLFGDTEWL